MALMALAVLLVAAWLVFSGGTPGPASYPPAPPPAPDTRASQAPLARTDPVRAQAGRSDRATPAAPRFELVPVSERPDGEPSPQFIDAALRAAIEEYLPGHKLSSDEYTRLSEAIIDVRRLRTEMSALDVSPENGERLRELRDELTEALTHFDEILDMSAAEFTARVQPGAGVTPELDDESPAEPEYLKDIPPRENRD